MVHLCYIPWQASGIISEAGVTDTNVLGRIRALYPSFSRSHQQLADYILDNLAEAAFQSSHDLARVVGISPSTVVRFAQFLGYGGYPPFQADLQTLLKWHLTPTIKLRATLAGHEAKEDVLQECLRADLAALEETMRSIAPKTFETVCDIMGAAPTVYLIGLGISVAVVHSLQFRLRRAGQQAIALTQGGCDLFEGLLSLGPDDVVLAVGFHRPHDEIFVALRFARERGATTVVLTDGPLSPLAREADYVLSAKRGPAGELNSLVVPMAVANALAIGVARRRVSQTTRAYEWVEQMQAAAADSRGREGG